MTGYYFKFDRGEWEKQDDEPTIFSPRSGLSYVGSLTKEQQEELDHLISRYIGGLREPS